MRVTIDGIPATLDHTGGLVADMLLEAAPFAPDTADMTDD